MLEKILVLLAAALVIPSVPVWGMEEAAVRLCRVRLVSEVEPEMTGKLNRVSIQDPDKSSGTPTQTP